MFELILLICITTQIINIRKCNNVCIVSTITKTECNTYNKILMYNRKSDKFAIYGFGTSLLYISHYNSLVCFAVLWFYILKVIARKFNLYADMK